MSSLASSAAATAVPPVVVSRPPSSLLISREKRNTVLCLVLVLLTLAFYNPIVHNRFTNLDDKVYVTDNAHVRAGLTWDTVKWAFTSYDAANWHPLTWLSHALDCQLFGLNPVGHHYVSLLLHAVNAVLLFLLLASATGFTWPSFMVAALFALHPLNVESVAWAAERKNVLSMLFFLLALHAYGWYARRNSVGRYAMVAALFALGLMAKPEIITLPFVLLLWDYWPLRRMGGGTAGPGPQFSVLKERSIEDPEVTGAPAPRSFSYLFLEKVPLLLLSAGSGVITLLAQSNGQAVRAASLQVRLGNAAVAYVRYLGKAFWPTRLAAMYPHLGYSLPAWEIAASAAVLVLLAALVLRWRSRRYLVTGWFWFLGTLVPVIGLVQVGVQSMADRYAYLPYIGLFVCVVWGVAETARARRIPAVWLVAPSVLVLLTLGILSRNQIAYWRDSESLWKHTLAVTEGNYFAHDALAGALAEQDRTDEAVVEFKAAQALHAYSPSEMLGVGVYEQTHGHVQEAIEQYQEALDAAPGPKTRAAALSCMGSAFTQMGDFGRARMSYGYSLQQNPNNTAALVGSGLLAERDGDFGAAADWISRAIKVEPSDVSYLLLGEALRRAGHLAEADAARSQAQKISGDFAQAQQSAVQAMASAGVKPD